MVFEELQRNLIERLGGRGISDLETGTIVVIPSITFPAQELQKIVGICHYEERLLCLLLFLGRPDVRMVFVTSMPVDPVVIDYYLSFLDDPEDARARLELISLGDPEPRALSEKLLRNPGAVERIRAAAGEPDQAYILNFNVTPLERSLSEQLGIALYGPHPDLIALGQKSGSLRIAAEAGVPVLDGAEDLWSVGEVERAIQALLARRPEADAVVIKLNDGFSGQGNAVIDVGHLASPLEESKTTFCSDIESWPSYKQKIAAGGAIVEELERHPATISPSVQMRIAPSGAFEVVSTHDQILGGPDDQVYLGCRFPARSHYRMDIQEAAIKVAGVLSAKGVIGPFGIDFVVVPEKQGNLVYLTEINLRMGGTTHPFLMTRLVTGGSYDDVTGELLVDGRPRYYMGTDNLKSETYVGLGPQEAIRAIAERGLGYDARAGKGATLHLLGALRGFGKLGVTSIGESPHEAEDLYHEVVKAIDSLAG
jgi:pheganomycin biosynthesis PGM1-like protein/ATP-grasp domain-containing protein